VPNGSAIRERDLLHACEIRVYGGRIDDLLAPSEHDRDGHRLGLGLMLGHGGSSLVPLVFGPGPAGAQDVLEEKDALELEKVLRECARCPRRGPQRTTAATHSPGGFAVDKPVCYRRVVRQKGDWVHEQCCCDEVVSWRTWSVT